MQGKLMTASIPRLKLLKHHQYRGVNDNDPLRYYYWPLVGHMYRRRVELCLAECKGGKRVLEVGFGTGLSFLNLHEMYDEIFGLDLTVNIDEVSSVFNQLGIRTSLQNGNVIQMPYEADTFDTVLLISILEHLQPIEQDAAFQEIRRVLKPNGQAVYGVPVERPFMVSVFHLLGYDIRKEHFSTEKQVAAAAEKYLSKERIVEMQSFPPLFGTVYEIGHFLKK
jgi:ubiquinone/menaquinone biosynthesis C-methylase UbiE